MLEHAPTICRLLARYKQLATGFGYVALRQLLMKEDYTKTRAAIEQEWIDSRNNGDASWYFTTTRDGTDIQIQVDLNLST